MTTELKVIKNKLGLLNLIQQLGNINQPFRIIGYSIDSFFVINQRRYPMSNVNAKSRFVKIYRWSGRIWSILVFAIALLRIFTPDPYATEPVPASDWFLLSLWGVAILGLLIAWRWELIGGIITIATMFFREIVWVILKGDWMVNFLIFWCLVVPPAILFLGAWRLERKTRKP